MRTRVLAAAVLAVATLGLGGCAEVVDGNGTEATSSASGDFPTVSPGPTESTDTPTPTPTTGTSTTGTSTGSSPDPDFRCPGITYSSARMTFDCLSDAMKVRTGGIVFSISMAQTVETSSGLIMEQGAMLYTGTDTTFPAIAADIRVDMTSKGMYGTSPKYELDDVEYSTIDGHKAYTVADTITYNPAWAKAKKSVVKTEKRWLVLVQLNDGRYTAWFASIPDIAKQYWARVPTAISSIKIND